MRKFVLKIMAIVILAFIFSSCDKKEEPDVPAPSLPPIESMKVDFGGFTSDTKIAEDVFADTTKLALFNSALTVGVWNIMLTVTLVVPVTAFYNSFNYAPAFVGDRTWQWSYDVNTLGGTYFARLTGNVKDEDVKWEMYISKTGIGAHGEFKWFEGTSDLDGNGGQWILYHSYQTQEAVIQIDWSKNNDEIGEIKYSYIRVSDNGDSKQLTDDSYLEYGLTEADYNAFYTINYSQRDRDSDSPLSVKIELNTTDYSGRLKAPHYYLGNEDWHCWDTVGYDVVCE